jgi:hypothetical protein
VFVVGETGGTWGTAQEVPGTAALNTGGVAVLSSVSCASAGNCAAGGSYSSSGNTQAFVVNETGGSWGTAQEVPGAAALNTGGNAYLSSVSCAPAGYCAAGGYYTDAHGHAQAFVDGTLTAAKATTATALSLSAAKVTYGHEQAERLTVTVTSHNSGTPGGKVTIKTGRTTVCTITLASGRGHCTLTPRQLRRGTYRLIASYPGSSHFTGSASARKTLVVK